MNYRVYSTPNPDIGRAPSPDSGRRPGHARCRNRGCLLGSKLSRVLVAGSLALCSLNAHSAGFRLLTVEDGEQPVVNAGLWYPTEAAVPAEPNTPFNLPVALNAAMGEANGGLIVISHGFGGWYAGHADTAAALADAGFLVVAPSHTGNTWSDMSSSTEQWALDRPRHVSRAIDAVLGSEPFGSAVDPRKIGVYGFSAGGYTALNLIGGVPDLEQASAFCERQPQEFVCANGMIAPLFSESMSQLPDSAWGADPRVRAAVIAAPGFGFAYSQASLADVTAPVQLWSGVLDESVPIDSNAGIIAANLPEEPETHWVEQANHFAFMVVACREAFRQNDPEEYEVVCSDAPGFDRRAFHETMHAEMIRFFTESFE